MASILTQYLLTTFTELTLTSVVATLRKVLTSRLALSSLPPFTSALLIYEYQSRHPLHLPHEQQQQQVQPLSSFPSVPNSNKFDTMAWRSSGTSNSELIENLWRNEMIKHPDAKSAFLKVDRAHYAPRSPYEDCPQPIGHHATISAPHMHASAVEHLLPFITPSEERPGPRVLDIGSGSGYLTHVLAELVGEQGKVVGVEHISELKELGERNMKKSKEGRELIEKGRVRFRVGDGRRGWIDDEDAEGKGKGWDAIHVGAAAVKVHEELLEQLASPGRMFIPVEDEGEGQGWGQHIWCVDKDEKGEVRKRKLFGVRYVPLTDAPKA